MRRISDEKFVDMPPYTADKVVGIRVKDGEFYFIAWMEDAPHYKIQKAMDPDGYLLNREHLIVDGDIFSAVQATDRYNNMYLLYCTDDSGNLINEDESKYFNEYDEFLALIKPYERNGVSDESDHDILLLDRNELSSFCDLLRDGDYILIVE